jgi:hypothetical protein
MRGRNIGIFYDAELELFESLQFCSMSDRSEALKEEISKSGPVISRSYQSSTNSSGNFHIIIGWEHHEVQERYGWYSGTTSEFGR